MHENGRSVSKPKFPIAPSIPMWRPNQVHTFHIYLHLKLFLTQKLLHIYTANHATFPIQIRKITVQICGDFWVHSKNGIKRFLPYICNKIGKSKLALGSMTIRYSQHLASIDDHSVFDLSDWRNDNSSSGHQCSGPRWGPRTSSRSGHVNDLIIMAE